MADVMSNAKKWERKNEEKKKMVVLQRRAT